MTPAELRKLSDEELVRRYRVALYIFTNPMMASSTFRAHRHMDAISRVAAKRGIVLATAKQVRQAAA